SGPFELSPERGRFALLYSFVEHRSLTFSVPVARFVVPDLAQNSAGQYVSLFAPGVSFIVMPGYLLGRMIGLSQVGTFMAVAVFAVLNMYLIRTISARVGTSRFSGTIAALTFGFATPAFAYGVDLYQHHISTFIILFSVFLLIRFQHPFAFMGVWFLAALSIVVDNPNLFLMLPIGLYAVYRFFGIYRDNVTADGKPIRRALLYLATFGVMALPMGGFLWYNQVAYGNPFQLPGTLHTVNEIGPDGRPMERSSYEFETGRTYKTSAADSATYEKTAVGFFKTRNMYDGFFTHFVSRDRGIVFYTPVILLGIVGLVLLYRTKPEIVALLTSVIGIDVLLYSLWGDPWGGWAFGSRYLIPAYALLAVGIAVGLTKWRWQWIFTAVFVPLFLYSAWVNTLGAVTTNMIPPKGQVLTMEQQSGHEEKYTFMRSWEFLQRKYSDVGVKSFVYQSWAGSFSDPIEYFAVVYGLVVLAGAGAGAGLVYEEIRNKR
ncbi:MAG: hypothetical protein WCE98_00550, partial [Chlorobium sp.]